MDLHLYCAFLVLMTSQSSLQYSFTFTQSHTHSYSASISSTLLFYEAQFGIQHLAQGHFGMQIFWEDLGMELPIFTLEDDHSTPSATAAPSINTSETRQKQTGLRRTKPSLLTKDEIDICAYIIIDI